MRKSRLVIQPTKCLNQIGFLLLFLSCPAIGDWGRIQPESEASHKAIQVAREGTCGLQRDLPAGLLTSVPGYDFDQCRIRGFDSDSQYITLPTDYRQGGVPEADEVNGFNYVNSQKNQRQRKDETSQARREQRGSRSDRGSTRRSVLSRESRQHQQQERREASERSSAERRADVRRQQRQVTVGRSRSLEGREAVLNGRSATYRSRSLNRVDERRDEVTLVRKPSPAGRDTFRREREDETRVTETKRTYQGRDYRREARTRERKSDIRMDARREESRLCGRRERFNERLPGDNRRLSNEPRFGRTSRHTTERDVPKGERLALSKRDRNDLRRTARSTENETRNFGQLNNERRQQRKEGDTSRAARLATRRTETETRTSIARRRIESTESTRRVDRQARNERMSQMDHITNHNRLGLKRELVPENFQLSKLIPIMDAPIPKIHQHFAEEMQREANNDIEKITQNQISMNFDTYDSKKVGDWTLNCVLGAVAYYFTINQVKTV